MGYGHGLETTKHKTELGAWVRACAARLPNSFEVSECT
jgi:hypothetical protein